MPGLSGRLRTFGRWGVTSPSSLTLNFTSNAAYQQALDYGQVSGLSWLSENWQGKHAASKPGEISTSELDALILAPRLVFPAEWSANDAWTAGLGSTYFEEFPRTFDSPALGHTDATADEPSQYTLTLAGAEIPENGSHALRFILFRPEDQIPMFTDAWHVYQIQIRDGSVEIMRRADAWTLEQEIDLYELFQTESELRQIVKPDASDLEDMQETQDAIEALRETIYEDRHNIATNQRGDFYGSVHTLSVIPEPSGVIHVWLDDTYTKVPQTDIQREVQRTSEPGVLWPECQQAIRNEGGAYYWQPGYAHSGPYGTMRLGRYNYTPWADQIEFDSTVGYLGITPAGTAIEVENVLIDDTWAELRVTLTTSNPRRTPFLYHLNLQIDAGERDGGRYDEEESLWDSDDHNTPVMDVQPSFEGVGRRQHYVVTMRNISGELFSDTDVVTPLHSLENEVCRVDIDGDPVITNGLILRVGTERMATLDETESWGVNANPFTVVDFDVLDGWAILDESIIWDDPIGDGMYTSEFIRLLLKGAGFNDDDLAGVPTAVQLAAVPIGTIRILPFPIPGMAPCIRPRPGVNRGDYLRSFVEEWCMGYILYQDIDGVWHFEAPSNAPVATFGPGGAHRVLDPLGSLRDTAEFYNYIRVESQDRYGNPLVEDYVLWKSINPVAGGYSGIHQSGTYIGRAKALIRQIPAARTREDLLWVRRSLQEQFQGTPRFRTFTSDYIPNIFPGMRVTHDGKLCRIQSIEGGSIARRRMNFTLQELE